jgi:hypothetical protein
MLNDEDMTILTFVANTGGLLGLCLGMSFVSIAEALYFVLLYAATKISNCFRPKTKPYEVR